MGMVFVTATGTGVGKTFVTCALIRQLAQRQVDVDAVKPVISGTDEAHMAELDTGLILKALDLDLSEQNIEAVSPWRFKAALSPDMAAAREGREIDFDELVDFCRLRSQQCDVLIVEGVGGAFVPLDPHHTVADWMAALNVAPLIVAGSYLGTLSHTLATAEALHGRGMAVRGIIISESPVHPVPIAETRDTLMRFLPGIPIVPVSRAANESDWRAVPDLTDLIHSSLPR